MLEWKIATRDEVLAKRIEDMKNTFDTWFRDYWARQTTKDVMLSEKSPLPHVYYLMTKPIEEVKLLLPDEGMYECGSCGKSVDEWIETAFSFCHEYGCGMSLCKDCAAKLAKQINGWIKKED